jgi:hypothetical protein
MGKVNPVPASMPKPLTRAYSIKHAVAFERYMIAYLPPENLGKSLIKGLIYTLRCYGIPMFIFPQ